MAILLVALFILLLLYLTSFMIEHPSGFAISILIFICLLVFLFPGLLFGPLLTIIMVLVFTFTPIYLIGFLFQFICDNVKRRP
jgi:hypothetical protein